MLVLDMLFVVSAVLFDMLKARQLACVSKSGQKCPAALSLSSWRAWIEILQMTNVLSDEACRSPHGERGLKYHRSTRPRQNIWSLSSWRAWIEILPHMQPDHSHRSLSSWRAWIEIQVKADFGLIIGVALLMESVD